MVCCQGGGAAMLDLGMGRRLDWVCRLLMRLCKPRAVSIRHCRAAHEDQHTGVAEDAVNHALCVGHIVDTITAPGVAAADPAGGEVTAFEAAVFGQSFESIGAAGGVVTAVETDPGAKEQAIGPDWQSHQMGQRAHRGSRCRRANALPKSSISFAKGRAAVVSLRPIKT